MSAFETLALIDWTYNYIKPLKRFGINDIFLINGMNNLCNAYSRKVHSQTNPLVVNILSTELDLDHPPII